METEEPIETPYSYTRWVDLGNKKVAYPLYLRGTLRRLLEAGKWAICYSYNSKYFGDQNDYISELDGWYWGFASFKKPEDLIILDSDFNDIEKVKRAIAELIYSLVANNLGITYDNTSFYLYGELLIKDEDFVGSCP